MNLTVVNQTEFKISEAKLGKAFDLIVRHFRKQKIRNKKNIQKHFAITFVFLNKNDMKKINLKYRKKNKATDVLSFSYDEATQLGDLVFCIEVLKKQAQQQLHSLDKELLYMMIHGLLHLLGYDHELSKKEEKLMFRLQNYCFEQLSHIQKTL